LSYSRRARSTVTADRPSRSKHAPAAVSPAGGGIGIRSRWHRGSRSLSSGSPPGPTLSGTRGNTLLRNGSIRVTVPSIQSASQTEPNPIARSWTCRPDPDRLHDLPRLRVDAGDGAVVTIRNPDAGLVDGDGDRPLRRVRRRARPRYQRPAGVIALAGGFRDDLPPDLERPLPPIAIAHGRANESVPDLPSFLAKLP
jgi:hypothetical protein